ncbi:hypothetical protein MAR_015517 [Mya arenaria]|uniref:Uncharacterized protein n=1 Tax=Mya arenaria TaxID=6604 RepID=A0ABY7FH87_MYAAR|nr:hypothetical protein MAR_015517 [Mya arenaria]
MVAVKQAYDEAIHLKTYPSNFCAKLAKPFSSRAPRRRATAKNLPIFCDQWKTPCFSGNLNISQIFCLLGLKWFSPVHHM